MNRVNTSTAFGRPQPSQLALRHGFAVVAIAVGFVLRLALTAWVGAGLPTYITFYPAVMAAALLGGLGPGLLATGLTGLVVCYWILPPVGELTIASPVDRVGLALFFIMGVFMSAVAEVYRRRRDKAAAYDRDLALRESQEALRNQVELMDHASEALIVRDLGGVIYAWNRGAETLYGWTTAEAVGQKLRLLVGSAAPVTKEIEVALVHSGHWEGELVHTTRAGRSVTVEVRATAAPTEDGRVLVLESLHDITERKQAEEALRLSEEKFATAFANNAAAIALTRLDDGRFLEVNETLLALSGYTRDEMIGRSARTTSVWADAEAGARYLNELREKGTLRGRQHELRTKSGEVLTVELSSHLLTMRGEQVILSTFVDITERKRAEEALLASRERLAAVIGSAMDAIITVDESQRVVLFNAAAEKIFRCTAAAVIGEPLERFLPERFCNIHRGHIQAFGATGVTSRSMHSAATISGLRSDGEEFPCEATISQASAGGQKLYTVILRDITERIKLEQLQQLAARLLEVREQERKDFAHELHENIAQYLAGVEMYVSSARSGGAAPSIEVQRFLDEGHSLLRQCSSDIQTMAEVMYPEALETFGLAAAIQAYVRSLKDQDGFEVSLDITPGLPRMPATHEITLYRVTEEALTNARMHSGTNAAEVHVSFDALEVRLEVIDAGRGMALPGGRASGHGTGIMEMGERIRGLGGKFEIVSGGDGTKVKAVLPFVPRQSEAPR